MSNNLTTTTPGELTRPDDRLQAVTWVLDGLQSEHTRRAYERHLTDFLAWHEAQGRPYRRPARLATRWASGHTLDNPAARARPVGPVLGNHP